MCRKGSHSEPQERGVPGRGVEDDADEVDAVPEGGDDLLRGRQPADLHQRAGPSPLPPPRPILSATLRPSWSGGRRDWGNGGPGWKARQTPLGLRRRWGGGVGGRDGRAAGAALTLVRSSAATGPPPVDRPLAPPTRNLAMSHGRIIMLDSDKIFGLKPNMGRLPSIDKKKGL